MKTSAVLRSASRRLAALGLGRVQHHAALAPVLHREHRIAGAVGRVRVEIAGRVAAGALDLDDLGAPLAHDHGAARRGHPGGHFHDLQTLEQHRRRLLLLPRGLRRSQAGKSAAFQPFVAAAPEGSNMTAAEVRNRRTRRRLGLPGRRHIFGNLPQPRGRPGGREDGGARTARARRHHRHQLGGRAGPLARGTGVGRRPARYGSRRVGDPPWSRRPTANLVRGGVRRMHAPLPLRPAEPWTGPESA